MGGPGRPENLKPVKPGEVRNPKGINQYTYRDRARRHLDKLMRRYGADFVETVVDLAREGESWAAKLVWDEVLPRETKVDHSGQIDIAPPAEPFQPDRDYRDGLVARLKANGDGRDLH